MFKYQLCIEFSHRSYTLTLLNLSNDTNSTGLFSSAFERTNGIACRKCFAYLNGKKKCVVLYVKLQVLWCTFVHATSVHICGMQTRKIHCTDSREI